MDFITAQEAADKWNIKRRRVQILCEDDRIIGAIKLVNLWLIPKDAIKPCDNRKTNKISFHKEGVCAAENVTENYGGKMENELFKTVQVMDSVYGLDISKYDDTFLKQATEKRCAATETKKISNYIIYLSNNKTEAQNLFGSLNITYTEFFRNPLTFAHLEQWILPELIERKLKTKELRIWSAGCSSGQEAYSIAMLVENIYAKKPFRYRIIATDILESALTTAKKGEYNQEAIQNIRVKDLNNFFEKPGEMYKVCDWLKKHVSFSTYDLLDDLSSSPQESIFGNFDLVICSNLLFYYQPEYQHLILKKLINAMAQKGYLITGEAERHVVTKVDGLRVVAPPSPIFQKKMEV